MASKGNDFLLKEGDGSSSEVFTTIAAMSATSLTIDGEEVRFPTKDDDDGWSELLEGGGEKTMTITAEGVFTNHDTQTSMRTKAMTGVLGNYQVDDGDSVVEGSFQVTNCEHTGDVNVEQAYSITLASSGKPTVT